jgi:hypothetical protein
VNRKGWTSGPLMLAFALVFLFETWIWGGMVAAARALATRIPWERFRAATRRFVNRMPVIVAVLLFGVPLLVSELGTVVSVILMATGHFIVGMAGYVFLKVAGLGSIALIFDLTREKLMTLSWFVILHEKFVAVHDFVHRLVAPYRAAAVAFLFGMRERTRVFWVQLGARARG